MISTKGRYALRVMIDLTLYGQERYIPLKEISKRQGISVKYLEQVIALLNRAGFLHSMRGNSGGYQLAKKPEAYTAGDILRAAEGNLAPIACLQGETNPCVRKSGCAALPFWEGLYSVVTQYVDSVTLRQLADNAQNLSADNYSI